MRVLESNRTIEGEEDALRWLKKHSGILPKLRRVLRQFHMQRGRDLPWRRTQDPYAIFIAEMLLQKTGSKPVVGIWRAFLDRFPSVQDLAEGPMGDVSGIIHPLGIHKRGEALMKAARIIVSDGGSRIPKDALFLRSLPNVGNYTTAAILSFAFNVKAAAIDVNGARIYTRIGGLIPNTARQGLAFARTIGERVVTHKFHKQINYGILDLSALVCRPKPRCETCPAKRYCFYGKQEF